MKKTRFAVLLLVFVLAAGMLPTSVSAKTNTRSSTTSEKSTASKKKVIPKIPLYVGGVKEFSFQGISSKKIKWSSSNPKVASVSKKGLITGKKLGKAYIIAQYKNSKIKFQVKVLSPKKYTKATIKEIAKNIKKETKSPYLRVIYAAIMVSSKTAYGSGSRNSFDVLTKRKGTCVSGNQLVADIIKAMGYKAKVRFAARDNMKRYPKGVYFYNQHHNVQVKIKGKTYYVDGTPGAGFVYLSSSKKPLFSAYNLYGEWFVSLNKIPA